jgi:hypothetical protein
LPACSEYGIASAIKITANLDSKVTVDYGVTHFASLENERLRTYTIATIIGIVISVIILAEKISTVLHRDWNEAKFGFIFDFFIQFLLPIGYFSIRFVQLKSSKGAMNDSIGKLASVSTRPRNTTAKTASIPFSTCSSSRRHAALLTPLCIVLVPSRATLQ